MRRPLSRYVFVGLALLALAACSNGASNGTGDSNGPTTSAGKTSSTGNGALDTCDLLTEKAVAPLVGEGSQPEAGAGAVKDDADTCTWRQTEGGGEKILSLTVTPAAQYPEVEAAQPDAEKLPGVGTAAFSAVGSTGPVVGATDGKHTFQLQLIGGTEADITVISSLIAEAIAAADTPNFIPNPNE